MDILIAKHSGFCEGVERAYRIALEQTRIGRTVFMLGNLVHNSQVVEKFKGLGVVTVKEISEIPEKSNGILLISAHGVSPRIYEQAKNLGLEIVDTTCPWVKKAQRIAKDLAQVGRLVIIVGDLGHPEVKALLGWSGGRGVVVENSGSIEKLALPAGEKVGILAQTTQAQENFDSVVNKIKEKYPNVEVHNTICGATAKRQAAAVEVARQVEIMLVVGDKMSANTKRLTELCTQTGTETHQIQSVGELNVSWLVNKKKAGVTAGASTPEWVIEEVIARLRAQ